MTYIKINETLYPATISGKVADKDWDSRASKSITLEMNYETASKLFVDGQKWSILNREEVLVEEPVYKTDENGDTILDENNMPIQIDSVTRVEVHESEYDNSEYSIAGDITDHRDGTITVKMGKLTDLEEAYEIMLGGM